LNGFAVSCLKGIYFLWKNHRWVSGFVLGVAIVLATWALVNLLVAVIAGAVLAHAVRYHTGNTIRSGFTNPVPNGHDPPHTSSKEQCHHVEACECFVARDGYILSLKQQNAELEQLLFAKLQELDRAQDQLQQAREELHDSRNIPYKSQPHFGNNPTLASMVPTYGAEPTYRADIAKVPYERVELEYERARRRIADLEQDKSNLILEKKHLLSTYSTELVKYKDLADYSQGAGEGMLIAQTEVDDLKANIRSLQRDNQALMEAAMQTRQALAAEREIHSEKCQDEAGCQMKISALEYKCKQLLDSHAYNDKMVVDAAIKFGMPVEDAQHVDLMAYLRAVTVEVARLKALGVRGLGATNTIDFTVKQLQDENQRITALKNRLEKEVDRLGGDVIGIRNGLDTTKPHDWAISLNCTYEENAYRIFPIYERLCETLGAVTEKLVSENVPLPFWEPEVPRNDQTNSPGFVASPQHVLEANKITNQIITSSEDLTQKLTINEVQRLYNRAQQLAITMKELSPKEALPSGEFIVKDPVVRDMLSTADKVFKEVLINILDDIRPVIASPTEQSLDPRMQKKFEIYTAMQEAIQALTGSIVANEHMPPQWLPNIEQLSRPWSSPDNLALNLMNAEMRTLEVRINQLLQCMTQLKLPGTLHGSPPFSNHPDPDYNARWYELVASTTYSRLVLSHWHLHLDQKEVQVQDETGQLKTISVPASNLMPLTNKDRYFRAAMGRGENEVEKEARELKEGKWPHPDAVQATVIVDPLTGPKIEFKILDPNAGGEVYSNGHQNGKKHEQNDNNSNSNDRNGRGDEYEKKVKEWQTKKSRIEQLKNHITHWGIKGDMVLPNVSAGLRKNADIEKIQRALDDWDEKINELTSRITQRGKSVPKMLHKGGKMHPK
jgi:hypothetical protein